MNRKPETPAGAVANAQAFGRLRLENQRLARLLEEAEDTLRALRSGGADAVFGGGGLAEQRHSADLKLAEEALREADRRRNEFVAILAHELRNPLGPIRNAARTLKLKGVEVPEFKGPIDMIERQTELLARLLDDLLDVSRVTRGAMEMRRERVLFSEVVEASVSACTEELREHGVQLQVSLPSEPVELLADSARLIQLICNLLTNAAKYTPERGKIVLTATTSDDLLTVSLKDTGIGIPHEKLTNIFELFAQVGDSGDRAGGLGIGLTLVRQIAALHGGSIEARSEGIGHGSEFVLKLPIVPLAPGARTPASVPPPSPVTPRQILVVDDNRDAAESLTALLQLAGHKVHFALDGESAIALAGQDRPEVVLLDLGMPHVSGYDVARRIREQPWGQRIYLVALSGWGQAEDRLRAREAGFDAHLVKPVAPEALDRLLESLGSRPGNAAAL